MKVQTMNVLHLENEIYLENGPVYIVESYIRQNILINQYLKKITLSSTMGPGVIIDQTSLK